MTRTSPKSSNTMAAAAAAVLASLIALTNVDHADAHGQLQSPRSRNEFARWEGSDSNVAGVPPKEYCSHCLNLNTGVCGKTNGGKDYDNYVDGFGNPMAWDSQATYTEGDTIQIETWLDTHHNGHMEIRACAMGPSSTQACFDTPGNELVFVSDLTSSSIVGGMPADPNYPERGYYAGGQGGSLQAFQMQFKLPDGIYGNEVMLQWKYITANSCSPPGYSEYFSTNSLPASFWTSGLSECSLPFPNDGTRSEVWPEIFFNCAEVTIDPAGPSPPTTSAPVPAPVAVPTSSGNGCCSQNFKDCVTHCGSTEPECCADQIWLPNGAQTGCLAKDADCTSDPNCCSGLTCFEVSPGFYHQCQYIESSPTDSPVASPTDPTSAPIPGSTGGGSCYSNDYKTCNHADYQSSEASCTTTFLPDGALDNCIALWGDCTGQTDDDCCGPALCFGDNLYAQCVVLPEETSAPASSPTAAPTPCVECDDVVTDWIANGSDCDDAALITSNCNQDANWQLNRFCRYSCHSAGLGYGDVCCAAPVRGLRRAQEGGSSNRKLGFFPST